MSKPNVGAVGVHGQLQSGIIGHLPLVAVQVPAVQGARILQVEAGDQCLHLASAHCAGWVTHWPCGDVAMSLAPPMKLMVNIPPIEMVITVGGWFMTLLYQHIYE